MEKTLLYKTGYATGYERDQCRGCWGHVATGNLYLAVMKPSRKQDEREPLHFHVKCFFEKQRLTTVDNLAGFEKLRTKDQTRITGYISRHNVAIVVPKDNEPKTKGGRKRAVAGSTVVKMSAKALRDFGVEYSKSGRAHCCGCRQKIPKGVVRCKKMVYTTEVGMQFGGQPLWHHFDCFVELRDELGWYGSGNQLPGFKELTADDQDMVMKSLSSAATLAAVPDAKKAKVDQSKEAKAAQKAEDKLNKLMKEQNVEYFKYRDILDKKLKKSNWIQILELNKQQIKTTKKNDEILDAAADCLTFGSLLPCPTCQGQLVFDKFGYTCSGRISEWAKCDYTNKEPPRKPTQVPTWLTSHFPNYHGEVIHRAVRNAAPTISVRRQFTENPEEQNWEPKVKREKPPLYSMEVGIIGRTVRPREKMKTAIEKMGGKLVTKIHDKLVAIISNEREIERMTARMEEAKNFGIQIVPENFVDDIADGGTIEYIKTASISEWGADPETRIAQDEPGVSKYRSIYTLAKPKSVKLKIVDGAAVDPASGLQDSTHVYINGETKYFAILSYTDIQEDKNSYYKLQLLESNNQNSYWVFSSWGRIGTSIGDNETKPFGSNFNRALSTFYNKYNEKTGNRFGAHITFVKKPGKFCPVDVDYDEKDLKKITDRPEIESKLPESVQKFMKWIFDINAMRKAMIEFDLDMEKMPLGKLSQRQFTEALNVLKEITQLIENAGSTVQFTGKSNHFYTLIPHDFGVRCPPILSTIDAVKTKIEMIETLMQLEIAYSFLQADTDSTISPIDCHYIQLKTEIIPLDSFDQEYKLIEKYLNNTHGPTHHYQLNVEQIFKISRDGEEKRYQPFKSLHNRKLLWHGSRLTNFVGIFSHGLKIAPPEAPASGYMFGKGVYFADMATKSANYCWTSTSGILLLCEVALGNMYELEQAKNIVKLPAKMHSVKGLGQTYPNPTESYIMPENGVEIPLGIPITDLSIGSSLLYNEYIVYDVAQVNVKYALKVNFTTK